MTPGARVQAAIELLDRIIAAARESGAAADTLIARYFAERRYAGSKDRRAVRELVYAAIRRAGEVPESGRAAMVGLARDDATIAIGFDGSAHGPAPIVGDEPAAKAGTAPAWIGKRFKASDIDPAEAAALVSRAPLDLRVNRLKGRDPPAALGDLGPEPIEGLPDAFRLPSGTAIEVTDAFRAGQIEVQDAGSQMVTLAAQAEPGMAVIDLCAGAGGKTLALAAAMDNRGAILATDTDRGRLSRLAPRADRAGVSIVETRLLDPNREDAALADWAGRADVVLIDAPCSGTGTWRRNPEARWRLTPARIDRLVATQKRLLDVAAPLVKPGGALVYIVCSLLDEEGAGQAVRFLADHSHWTAEQPIPFGRERGPGRRLTPLHDATDGFFVARLIRPC
ncbi:RsmB/NOP family class I SAM-dependent RNA methyltransferase [Sphingomonas panacisoli]|uniref:RsmB/NOP family class I SAM-dependent RNA methyltransferase n=1 Tax=Sphingomonas panacisoli TaxID=1813879 RepID=A0A5B8LIY2_9SPHN|nr:RsmB/NOP family class I SAM-dependent RNA methyltransferase [Sphingomonas panacisoli]QDZ07562.1 RsmB/NOP family class I SAM-dependent RNA methyltransferase [Sphingomonas panacisoli]